MTNELQPGASRSERIVVDVERSIGFLGDEWRVYSTPSMVNDVEYACLRLIQEHLEQGQSSVGVEVSMEHLAATPLGHSVSVHVSVIAVEGRRVKCQARVEDDLEVVGRGEHTRFVIDVASHRRRIEDKKARLESGR